MANETELERMVVRLIGDASQYQTMLKESVANTESSMEQIRSATGTIGAGQVAMGTMAAHVIENMSSKIKEFAKDAIRSYLTYEDSEIRLRAALESNRRNVEAAFAGYKAFSKEMSNVANTSTRTSFNMLQLAETMGLTGQQAERAVKNAIGLAAVRGMDPESFIRMTVALEQGSTVMLTRYLPILRTIKDESERAAKAQEMLGGMFGTATKLADSNSGHLEKLEKAVAGLGKQYGEVTIKALIPYIDKIIDVVKWMGTFNESTVVTITIVGGLTVAIGSLVPLISTCAQGLVALIELDIVASITRRLAPLRLGIELLGTLISQAYVWGIALKAALVVGAIAAIAWAANATLEWLSNQSQLNSELEKTAALNERINASRTNATQGSIKEANKLHSGGDASGAKAVLDSALKNAIGTRDNLKNDAKKVQDRLDSWGSWFNDTGNAREGMAKEVENYKKEIAGAQKNVEALQAAQQKLDQTESLNKAARAFAELKKGMAEFTKETVAKNEVFGMSSGQAELYKLRKAGINPNSFEYQSAEAAVNNQDWLEKKKAIDDVMASTERLRVTANMSAAEIAAHDAAMLGASPAQQLRIQQVNEWAEAQKKAKQAADDLTKGITELTTSLQQQAAQGSYEASLGRKLTSAEKSIADLYDKGATKEQLAGALAAQKQIDYLDKFNKMLEQGKAVTEKYVTPLDKLIKTKTELSDMLAANAISVDVYNKALQEAEAQAHKDYTAEFKVDGIEALVWGSQAANKAWKEYQLGKMPLPQEINKAQAIPQDRKFEWQGEDTTVTADGNANIQQVEKLRNIETYMLDLRNIAQQHWQGETVTLQPSGLI